MVKAASLEELKAELKGVLDAQAAIEANADENGGGLTTEQLAEHKSLDEKAEKIEEKIASAQEFEASRKRREKRAALAKPKPRTQGANAPLESGQVGNPQANFETDPNCGFESSTEFFTGIVQGVKTGVVDDPRLKFLAVGSDEGSTFSDPHGNYLLPKGFRPDLKQIQAESDPTMGMTTKVPMSEKSLDIPARVDKNHNTSVSGGLRVYRRGEAETVTPSRFELEQVGLKLHELMGISHQTRELINRSPISVAALLARGFRDEFGSKIIDEKLNGSGVGMYEGVLKSPCTVVVSKEDGQGADTILGENITNMIARCHKFGRAIWLANQNVIPQLKVAHQALTNSDKRVEFSWVSDGVGMLEGRPIYFTEACELLGDKGDLILGDWSQYLEASAGGIQQESTIHVRWENHEESFKFWSENDGRCWWRSALTPKKSAPTLSPFVVLENRA